MQRHVVGLVKTLQTHLAHELSPRDQRGFHRIIARFILLSKPGEEITLLRHENGSSAILPPSQVQTLCLSRNVWTCLDKARFFSEWKTRLWSVWKGNNVSGLTSKFGWSCNIDRMVQLHSSAPQKATFLLFNAYGSVRVQDQMGWGTNLHIRVRCVFADVQRQRGLKWYARSQAIWSSGTLSHTLGKSTETRRVFSQLLLRLDQWIWLMSPPRRCRNENIVSRLVQGANHRVNVYYKCKEKNSIRWGTDNLGNGIPAPYARAPSSQDVFRLQRDAQSKQSERDFLFRPKWKHLVWWSSLGCQHLDEVKVQRWWKGLSTLNPQVALPPPRRVLQRPFTFVGCAGLNKIKKCSKFKSKNAKSPD